jgi:hypothetical protein
MHTWFFPSLLSRAAEVRAKSIFEISSIKYVSRDRLKKFRV